MPDPISGPPIADSPANGRHAPSPARVVTAIPGLVRFAVVASVRTAGVSAAATVRVGSIVTRAAVDGQSPSGVLEELAAEAVDYARRLLEASESSPNAASVSTSASPPVRASSRSTSATQGAVAVVQQTIARAPWLGAEKANRETLQTMYDALIEESNDVHHHEENHPAYVRVMQELTPDEARILRLMAVKGPQPALDVRTAGTFGFGSKLVKPGVTMIAAHAGCQDPDRVPSYLNNLHRLGLIWFSREMIGDVNSYALIEAQPEVMDAAEELGGKGKIRNVLRSIELTAFGKNLCALCGLLGPDEIQTRASLSEVTQRLPAPDER